MTWELSEQEKEGVYAAPDEKRYAYFVGHVADWGEAWSLTLGDSWVSLNLEDQRYFPAWPHPGFAEENVKGAWAEAEIEPIDVDTFVAWLDKLAEKGDGVALYVRKEGDFITVPPEPLKADLESALAEIR
jgi:hypothetical protein